MKLLFVCTGNSCRSVMAEGLLKQLLKERGRNDVQVLSAGTNALNGIPPTLETIQVMKARGVDVSRHTGQQLTPELVQHADAIFCMEQFHRDLVEGMDEASRGKLFLLKEFNAPRPPQDPDIPDPIGRPVEVYESCVETIREAVQRVVQWLEKR